MRSLLSGIVVTLLFAFGGNVHANQLDGKALVCVNKYGVTNGLLFANGQVTVYYVKGYEIIEGKSVVYDYDGTSTVKWFYIENMSPKTFILDRETLKINYHGDCELSTEGKIRSILNNIIAKAKKRNKI